MPYRSGRLGALRFVRMAVAFVVVAGSLGLATVAATAQGGGSCPSDGAPAYSDVPETSFAFDDSRCLRELGVSDAGDAYRPGDDMTRSEMAAFMASAYAVLTGSEAPIEDHGFSDVAGDPNAEDIARISPNGLMITRGTGDGTTYSPNDPVRRDQMALFLTRLYKAVSGDDADGGATPFVDLGAAQGGAETVTAVGQLYALGVTTGTSPTTYSPDRNVTREEMASFVARMYRVLAAMDADPAVAAPTGVAATPAGSAGTALEISWAAVEGADSYVVQWGAGYANQQTTAGTSVSVFGLTAGAAVDVRVAAVTDDGQSDWATTTGTPGVTPGAVSNLRAAPGEAPGTINVTWAAPADDGGTPLTGYVITWAEGNNTQESASVSNASATSHTIKGLNSAAFYYVWVTAVNGAGNGEASNPVTATPTGNVASGTVKISLPDGPDAGGRFASLSWPTVTPGDGQGLVNYTIHRKCGNELWPDAVFPAVAARMGTHTNGPTVANQLLDVSNVDLLGGALNATDAGTLQNGVECTYRVRANIFVGADLTSFDANAGDRYIDDLVWVEGKATPMATTAPPAAPTGVPGAVTLEAIGGNRIVQVNWGLVPDPDGSPVTGYKVTLSSPATVPVASVTVNATTESHTFTGLTNTWAYTASVVAINARGDGADPASPPSATAAPAPGAPTNLRVTQGATPGTSLKVEWNAPAANNLAAVSGYILQRRTSATADEAAGGWGDEAPTPPSGTATMIEDTASLAAGTSYDYRIRATTDTGGASPGVWSATASGTPSGIPSSSASNLVAFPNEGSLTLVWAPGVGNGSDVTSYSLSYRKSPNEGYNPWVSAGSVAASSLPTKTITGLSNGQAYEVRIFAHNAQGRSETAETVTETPVAGSGSLSAPTSIKTTVVSAPTRAITGVFTNASNAGIDVTWNAVRGAAGYTVDYLEVSGAPADVDPANGEWLDTGVAHVAGTTTASITGLSVEDGATYVVRVRASSPVGRYGFSAAVKAELAPTFTARALDMSVVGIVGTPTLRVDWTALDATTARTQRVTGYKVSWQPQEPLVSGNRGNATVPAPAEPGSAMSYNITGLTAIGQPIVVSVQAVNNVGAGSGDGYVYPPTS